jgi:hypothetical protein
MAAVALWGEAGTYAHDAYARLLPCYPELLEKLPIVIGITAYGHCIGMTQCCWEHGPRITIVSNLFTARSGLPFRFAIAAHPFHKFVVSSRYSRLRAL